MPARAHRLELNAPSASPEEAAAIAAAIGSFMRSTAPAAPAPAPEDRWARAAMLEGVSREPGAFEPHPWINT